VSGFIGLGLFKAEESIPFSIVLQLFDNFHVVKVDTNSLTSFRARKSLQQFWQGHLTQHSLERFF